MFVIQESLYIKSIENSSIMINLSVNSCNHILDGSKTVIVLQTLPQDFTYFIDRRYTAYIFNKNMGIIGECSISFLRRNVCGYRHISDYKQHPEKYERIVEELNKHTDLSGTCLSYEDFRKIVGIGRHYFFEIHHFSPYDPPLPIDEFWIGREGKNGDFAPSEKFKYPRTWCYALKKSDIKDMEKELS